MSHAELKMMKNDKTIEGTRRLQVPAQRTGLLEGVYREARHLDHPASSQHQHVYE